MVYTMDIQLTKQYVSRLKSKIELKRQQAADCTDINKCKVLQMDIAAGERELASIKKSLIEYVGL